jgi:hypothetical protein
MSITRFLAPPHVSAAFLSRGKVAVVDGVLELAGDIAHGDWIGLLAHGFALAETVAAKAPPAKAEPAPQKGA